MRSPPPPLSASHSNLDASADGSHDIQRANTGTSMSYHPMLDHVQRTSNGAIVPRERTPTSVEENDHKSVHKSGKKIEKVLSEITSSLHGLHHAPGSHEPDGIYYEDDLLTNEAEHVYSRFVILPTTFWKQLWDILVLFFVIYTCIMLPLELAFVQSDAVGNAATDGWYKTSYMKEAREMNYMVDFVFVVDLVLNFFVSYNEKHHWVTDLRKIRGRYLRSSFIVDLVASFPFDLLLNSKSSSLAVVKILKTPRLLRVVRLTRNTRSQRVRLFATVYKIVRLYVMLLMTVHWLLCVFALTVQYTEPSTADDWYFLYFGKPANIVPWLHKYFACMYAMLLALFGGDPAPIGQLQTAYICVVRFVGPVLQALVFGNIAMVLSNQMASALDFQERMQLVQRSVVQMKLPAEYVDRVMKYFEFHWDYSRHNDHEWVWELNEDLRVGVLIHTHAKVIQNVPIFKKASSGFLIQLVMHLSTSLFLPGDHIIREHDLARGMYFVIEGVCDTVKINDMGDGSKEEELIVLRTLRSGDFFGEVALLLQNVKRTASVIARTYLALNVLSKDDFDDILAAFPETAKEFRVVAERRVTDADLKKRIFVAQTHKFKVVGSHRDLDKASPETASMVKRLSNAAQLSTLSENSDLDLDDEIDDENEDEDDANDGEVKIDSTPRQEETPAAPVRSATTGALRKLSSKGSSINMLGAGKRMATLSRARSEFNRKASFYIAEQRLHRRSRFCFSCLVLIELVSQQVSIFTGAGSAMPAPIANPGGLKHDATRGYVRLNSVGNIKSSAVLPVTGGGRRRASPDEYNDAAQRAQNFNKRVGTIHETLSSLQRTNASLQKEMHEMKSVVGVLTLPGPSLPDALPFGHVHLSATRLQVKQNADTLHHVDHKIDKVAFSASHGHQHGAHHHGIIH